MDFFDRLGADHARLHDVSAALESFANAIDRGETADVHELVRFITFFRGYGDGLHHEREEVVLWPFLTLVGMSPDFGPLRHIQDEHREEARLLLQMEKAICRRPPWLEIERATIVRSALDFIAFLRAHMAKEYELLFPYARKQLVSYADALDKESERFERKRAPRWDVPWLEQLAAELVASHPKKG